MYRLLIALAGCLGATGGLAFEPDLPTSARPTAEELDALGSVDIALSGWRDGNMVFRQVEGTVRHRSWQITTSDLTTLQILEPLRRQFLETGYEELFSCEARACGGFDFRYAIDVVAEPAMHVDLGDFRYLSLRRSEGEQDEYAALLVSRSSGRGFVQLTQISQSNTPAASIAEGQVAEAETPVPSPASPSPSLRGIAATLVATGHAVLPDLTFPTGSSQLAEGPFGSLDELAQYLADNPQARVVLVGHTDAEGTLPANISLSRKRALAVRDRLLRDYDLPQDRVVAEGVGYLSPLTSNATEAGRNTNRRVEVVLSNVE
ncbi:OmpA family protein [Tropicimonas marinistellae]|uniref:OmpA family protein n=1 Tax=Tropicimonas marinistellae TaxID=1739787 RepID=UPI00082E87C1|nr:OmpA family protein [Tropicimonas marinistellae]